uniref:Uncharacterized protein n=1 Tax=Anguilla anguilla TaxID=7936 RepID=A0A0E9WG44_ANGAN
MARLPSNCWAIADRIQIFPMPSSITGQLRSHFLSCSSSQSALSPTTPSAASTYTPRSMRHPAPGTA